CDPLAFAAGHGGAAIQTVRQFQPYPGHAGTHALHKTTVEFLRLRFQTGGNYVNSGIAQQLITPAGHQWVGVSAGADHTRDTGVNQAFGAGRGAAMVAAGFQSNVGGGATGLFSGHAQGVHFGVGFTGFLMPAFTDDLALLADNNATDAGIGAGGPAPQFCQLQGAGHIKFVVHSLWPPGWREDDRRSISARNSSRSLKLRYTEAKRT